MNILAAVLILLVSTSSWASDFVFFDPNDAQVPGRVLQHRRSLNETPALQARSDVLINPTISGAVRAIPYRHWIVTGGLVGSMDPNQIALVDAERIANFAQVAADNAELTALRALLVTAYTNWGSLTDVQRATASRRAIRYTILLGRRTGVSQ